MQHEASKELRRQLQKLWQAIGPELVELNDGLEDAAALAEGVADHFASWFVGPHADAAWYDEWCGLGWEQKVTLVKAVLFRQ